MKCNKCGAPAWTPGKLMIRVNETGVDGIFECRPSCDHAMTKEQALLKALEENETSSDGRLDADD